MLYNINKDFTDISENIIILSERQRYLVKFTLQSPNSSDHGDYIMHKQH